DKTTILERQEAVKEIAAKNDWKLEFQAYLVFCLKQNREQVKNLLGYLKIPVELEDAKWLRLYMQVAPWLLLGLIVASIFYMPARYVVPLLGLANYRLVSSKSESIKKADLIAGKIGETLVHFSSAFKIIEEENWQSIYNQGLHSKIRPGGGESISAKIEQLSRLIDKLNYRLNLLVGFVLNVFLLWDIRQIMAIEEWKKSNHQNFDIAFDALAEFEAMVSLASLAVNYPGWCMPEVVDDSSYTLNAQGLGHPLINRNKRVENNFTLDDAFKIDIITGSNMAGKSTFLRTIGINTVLALCGAPACAVDMKVSVMTILSYMRIKDSLNESTSTFKAEIDRLQMLLKAVDGHEKIYFLIDEMLRGTNSADKYLGSKAVIERLIERKAVGIVATHDLQIAELEKQYPDYIRNFYFDIQVKNGEMLFDYKIKGGECKTFNASLLLEQIGIHVNEAVELKSKSRN
ncbi:MAG TPA: DNA mismatch repair protein MutS, partial [Mucilaginibacter sp.]|nr:DNA mismatch repair protein MutS [Mucilaginibacter sp.]